MQDIRQTEKQGNLYYMDLSTVGRMLVASNTFKTPCEAEEYQHVVDYIKRLQSDEVKHTPLRFSMIF